MSFPRLGGAVGGPCAEGTGAIVLRTGGEMDRTRRGDELAQRHRRDGWCGRDAGVGGVESTGAGVRVVREDRGIDAVRLDGHQEVVAACQELEGAYKGGFVCEERLEYRGV